MAEVTSTDIAALTAELRNFTNALKGGGMGVGGDLTKEFKQLQQATRATAKEYANSVLARKRQDDEYKKAVTGLVESLNEKQLATAANIYKETLKNSSNAWARSLGASINSTEDFIAIQRMSSDQMLDDVKRARILNDGEAHQRREAVELLAQYNLGVDDLIKSDQELTDVTRELANASVKTHREMEGGIFNLTGRMKMFGAAILGVITAVAKVGESAARTGTQLEYIDAAMMGMSSEELNQLQAEHRQIIGASKMTLDEFNETVGKSGSEMILYTGSLRDAARLEAQSLQQAKLLGAEQAVFAGQERERFKRLHNSMAMTTEQFMELNDQLLNNSEVQSQLFRLNMKQRSAFMADLKNTYEKLRIDGLTHEQAQKVLDTFTAIGAKSPKERLKEAAKLQAVMGVVGMGGQQAARAAELIRTRQTGTPEFAELMKQTQQAIGGITQQGLPQEMMISQMLESTGLAQTLGPTGSLVALGTQQGAAIDLQTANQNRQINLLESQLGIGSNMLSTMITGFQKITTLLGSGITIALTGLAAFFLRGTFARTLSQTMLPMLSNKITGGLTGASKMKVGAGGGIAGGILAGGASLMMGGDAGASAVGGTVGGIAGSVIGSFIGPIGTIVGGAVGTAVGGAIGEYLGNEKTPSTELTDLQIRAAEKAREIEEVKASGYGEEQVKLFKELIEEQRKLQEQISKANEEKLKQDEKWKQKEEELANKQMQQQDDHHADSKRTLEKGYRVQWARAPRNTAVSTS